MDVPYLYYSLDLAGLMDLYYKFNRMDYTSVLHVQLDGSYVYATSSKKMEYTSVL